jgi:hypothetical protein
MDLEKEDICSPQRIGGVSRDQDRVLIIWFCTDGGSKDSLVQLLTKQKSTFGIKLSRPQKKQIQNRISYIKRFWFQQEDRAPFTKFLRQRGFAELASKIDRQDQESVPRYILQQKQTSTPSRATPQTVETFSATTKASPTKDEVDSDFGSVPEYPTPRTLQFVTPTSEKMDHLTRAPNRNGGSGATNRECGAFDTVTVRTCHLTNILSSIHPKIPYDYYKLPYNYYLFLTEFCNATKPYQSRRMNVGISSKILHQLVCAALELHWKSVRMCVEHRRGLAKHT